MRTTQDEHLSLIHVHSHPTKEVLCFLCQYCNCSIVCMMQSTSECSSTKMIPLYVRCKSLGVVCAPNEFDPWKILMVYELVHMFHQHAFVMESKIQDPQSTM